MKNALLLFVLLLSGSRLLAQPTRIYLDGQFNDWPAGLPSATDPAGDDNNTIDLLGMSVTNDSNFLYIRLALDSVLNMQDSPVELFIDTDNDASTGFEIGGMGADFTYHFGFRQGSFEGMGLLGQSLFGLVTLPTVTSDTFEIALYRHARPDNQKKLFTSNTIRILFQSVFSGGDLMPDNGSFSYTFSNALLPAYPRITLMKEDTTLLRICNYNVLRDRPFQTLHQNTFIRIFKAIRADIWCFNELYNTSAADMKQLMDNIMPTGTAEGWYTAKLGVDNITVSRYPIKESWLVATGYSSTASLIDLPAPFRHDIMVVNSHFRCCTANLERQQEADAVTAFWLDAQRPGGTVTVADSTAFILTGDLNLVGDRQQLTTLLQGDIQDEVTYGMGRLPDWDTTALEDLISYHTDAPVAYTWRDESSDFAPGWLDFMIYTGSVMKMKKTFILETNKMTPARLSQYTLDATDTDVSDHLPKVADFALPRTDTDTGTIGFKPAAKPSGIEIYPNPFSDVFWVKFPSGIGQVSISLSDMAGRVKWEGQILNGQAPVSVAHLPAGVYLLRVVNGGQVWYGKVIKGQ